VQRDCWNSGDCVARSSQVRSNHVTCICDEVAGRPRRIHCMYRQRVLQVVELNSSPSRHRQSDKALSDAVWDARRWPGFRTCAVSLDTFVLRRRSQEIPPQNNVSNGRIFWKQIPRQHTTDMHTILWAVRLRSVHTQLAYIQMLQSPRLKIFHKIRALKCVEQITLSSRNDP
jgi:hypothetical protein